VRREKPFVWSDIATGSTRSWTEVKLKSRTTPTTTPARWPIVNGLPRASAGVPQPNCRTAASFTT
jgi:hypothetical protein